MGYLGCLRWLICPAEMSRKIMGMLIEVATSTADEKKAGWFFRITGGDTKYLMDYVRSLLEEAKRTVFQATYED